MKLFATSIVKNKFWDVKNNGKKIGFLEANDRGYTFKEVNTALPHRRHFPTLDSLKTQLDVEFEKDRQDSAIAVNQANNLLVYGYLASVLPYNKLFDIRQQLPLFTKTAKSRSYYCAGYYIIKFGEVGWIIANNPKLITINKYPYRGPFLSNEDASAARNMLSNSVDN